MNKHSIKIRQFTFLHFFTLLGGIIILILAVANSATADYKLPPRNTPDPTAEPNSQSGSVTSAGGRVHLRVLFSRDWPWDTMHWQEGLWHVIEWNDHAGTWYAVDGWQGTLETIQQEDDRWVGQKELWVAQDNFGAGPFRWLIYKGEGGALMATSPEFYLPSESGNTISVELELSP